jgi:hypothetical protein
MGGREILLAAAHHEGQRACAGAADPARNRCVDRALPGIRHQPADLARAFHVDGGAIDEQCILRRGAEQRGNGGQDVMAGGKHGDDAVGALHGIVRTVGDRHLHGVGSIHGRLREVEALHAVTGADEVGGHGRAHVA